MKLAFSHLSIPKQGESVSGDTVVTRMSGDVVLLAVLDALGHGPLAAAVASRGHDYLMSVPLDRSARPLMEGLHDALRGTRGAAALCCLIREDRIEGCGIGNVEMRSIGSRIPVVLTPGIVGVRYQPMRIFEGPLAPGSRILIFSDGVLARMDVQQCAELSPDGACKALMDRYRKPQDDATLLIADVGEQSSEGV